MTIDYRIRRTPLSPGLADALVELEGVIKARSRNFREAAEALGISQESLSRARAGFSPWTNQDGITNRIRNWITRPDEVWTLEDYIKSHNLTQAGAAKKLNLAPSTLSQILDGSYFREYPRVTGTRVLPRIKEFVWSLQSGIERPEISFLKTSVARAIFGVCRVARQDRKKIMLVAANPGTGKTTAFKRYQFERQGTIFIELPVGVGKRQVLQIIMEASHLKGMCTTEASRKRVIERFKGSDELLIVDEANQLDLSGLEMLRHIKDTTGVGMVLSGTLELLKKIENESEERLGQLADRIRIKLKIETITKEDANMYIRAALAGHNGQITDELCNQIFLLSAVRQKQKPWVSMRRIENLVEETLRLARERKEKISKEMINDAWGLCSGIQTN